MVLPSFGQCGNVLSMQPFEIIASEKFTWELAHDEFGNAYTVSSYSSTWILTIQVEVLFFQKRELLAMGSLEGISFGTKTASKR